MLTVRQPLKVNHSSLDLSQSPVSHFLHAGVHSHDYPWVVAEELEKRQQYQQQDTEMEDDSGGDDSDGDGYDENIDGIPMDPDDFPIPSRKWSPIFNTNGAEDDEYDTEVNTDEEEREMVSTAREEALKDRAKEMKLQELHGGAE